jgi:hypothetical protein
MRTPNLREVELRRRLGYTHVLTRKSGTALAWAHSECWAFDLVSRLEKAGSARPDDILIVPLQEIVCSGTRSEEQPAARNAPVHQSQRENSLLEGINYRAQPASESSQAYNAAATGDRSVSTIPLFDERKPWLRAILSRANSLLITGLTGVFASFQAKLMPRRDALIFRD